MNRNSLIGWGCALAVSVLMVDACGGTTGNQSSGGQVPGGQAPATQQSAAASGKDISNFDACSVVSDSEYAQAVTADSSGTPLGPITVTHAPVDGSITGLPGAKACQLSYAITDSFGNRSDGHAPCTVTFDKYSYLAELQGSAPTVVNDYASAGAQAFLGPGSSGDPYITKDGYIFRLSGSLFKTVALGIASRL
jgi:hypothetical protein